MANGYRKDSIFWALTLIAVGALFLYTNVHQDVRPWHIIAKYWPVLIIFWGLSKLYAFFRYRNQPNVPPGPFISGGEIVALVFLLIIGTAVSSAVRHSDVFLHGPGIRIDGEEGTFSFDNLFGNQYEFTEQVEAAAKPKPAIDIPDVRGDVKITGWDQPKIQVLVKKHVHAENEAEAKDRAAFLKTTITEEAGQYHIATNRQDALNKGYRLTTDLEINVPKDSRITTTQQRGNVTLTGLVGDQSVDSGRGDLVLTQITGNVVLKMSRGDVKVNDVTGNVDVSGRGNDVSIATVGGNASVNGEFYSIDLQGIKKQARFLSSRTDLLTEKVEGGVRLESGNLMVHNVNGPFTVKTKDKDITLDDVTGLVRVENNHGNVQCRASSPPKMDVEIQTESASIELALPRNASFSIDGKARSGDIHSDFKAPTLKVTEDQPTNEITGSFGKGGPRIKLSTSYGNLRLTER
jgi:DUF4097 and DUF4098 domain-containing protein YvlB